MDSELWFSRLGAQTWAAAVEALRASFDAEVFAQPWVIEVDESADRAYAIEAL